MATRVADVRSGQSGKFDPGLKDADEGFFLSKLLQVDAMKDFVKGATDRPQAGDISNLPEDLNPIDNLEAFRDAVRKHSEMSLAGIIFGKLLLPDLIKAGMAAITTSGIGAVTPLFTKQIIGYVDTAAPTAAEQSSAYGFSGAWVGSHGAKIFSKEYVGKVMFQNALKAEQILNVEIIRKITRLRPDIRKVYQNGDELKVLTGHVSTTFSFIRACAILIASPTKLIAVQFLIYNEIGYLGLVMIGVIVAIGLIQVLISRKLTSAKKIKKDACIERSEFNLSSFASIKHIRQLGWQDYIMKKNKEIREKENQANQQFYMLENVSSTLAHMAPTLIILIILLVGELTTYQVEFTIAKVYTVLAFVGMSYNPARSLFEVIFLTLEGIAALKKIDVLLKLPETEEVDQTDKQLEPGQVLARKGYLGSFEEQYERLSQLPDKMVEKADATELNVFNPKAKIAQQEQQLSDLLSIEKYKIKVASLTILDALFIHPGDRYLVLGSAKDRKAFLYAIMGKLKTVDGKIRYGGKLSSIPESPWLKKDTIKQNVLFGLEEDPAKLKKVYEVTKLNEELKKLPKQQDTLVCEDLSNLTTGQTMSIAIARTLYTEPDIVLLENTFDWFKDEEAAKEIFDNICRQYPNTTIIQSTHPFNELPISDSNSSSDTRARINQVPRVLLVDNAKKEKNIIVYIEEGFVKQMEQFDRILEQPQSQIYRFLRPKGPEKKGSKLQSIRLMMEPEEQAQAQAQLQAQQYIEGDNQDIIDQEIDWIQAEQRSKRKEELKYKTQKFVTYLLKYSEGMSKEQIAEKLLNEANYQQKAPEKPKRMKGVPWAVYVTLFRSVGYRPYILLMLLLIFTEATRIFSDWWLGSLHNLPWQLRQAHAVYIYVGLSAGYSLLSFSIGLTGPKISRDSSEAIARKVCNTLAKSRLSWFEGKDVSDIANRINLNTEEIFRLNQIARNIIRNILLFVATMLLVGFNNPSYAGVAVGITIVALVIMFLYIQQERQTVDLGRQFKEPVNDAFEHAVKGTQAMKAVNQLDSYRDDVVMPIYRMQAHKNYDKNINHGMAILTKLASLIGVTGTAFMSVGSNSPTDTFAGDPAIAGTSITFTQKLNQIMVNISKDFKNLEQGLRESVVKAYLALEDARQDRNGVVPPPEWPVHNIIRFVNVTLEEPDHSLPALIDETFTIPAGKKVVICGMRGGKAIMMATCRQIEPQSGRIEIGGTDIKTIKPSELAKKVMMLEEDPFFFNGTIKENLSPKQEEKITDHKKTKEEEKARKDFDNHLKLLLKLVGIWDSLPTASSIPKNPASLSESGEGSFSALSFFDEDSKSRMARIVREEEQLITEEKLYYKITDVKKQLSCGIRQRLNIVRALLLKPKVLLCHNHLSYLRRKTAAELDKLLITKLKDTTIVYYIPKPDPKDPMYGIDRVYYSSRGELLDMGGIKVEPTRATLSLQYYPPNKRVMVPEEPVQLISVRSRFAQIINTVNPTLYAQMRDKLRQPIPRQTNETIWERVDKLIQTEYNDAISSSPEGMVQEAGQAGPDDKRSQDLPSRSGNPTLKQQLEPLKASSQPNAQIQTDQSGLPTINLGAKSRTNTAQPFPSNK